MNKYLGIVLLGILLMACTHGSEKTLPAEVKGKPQAEVWFDGSVEQAFERAKTENKLLFVYWGAVWCPPCNELKSEVFSQARFAELMQNFIPVYLDGDTEAAQIWGDRLEASGYPTVLVLTADQKEIFRLNSVVGIDEFSTVIGTLLADSQGFKKALAAADSGKGSEQDYKILAYTSWDSLPEHDWSAPRKIAALSMLLKTCPTNLKKEKALLAAAYLSELAGDKKNAQPKDLDQAWKAVFADDASVWAARGFINSQAEDLVAWLAWKPKDKRYAELKNHWLAAARVVQNHPQASVDTKLWSVYPELAFFRYEQPEAELPADLKSKIENAVAIADQDAKSDFERHAVISGAAYLLRKVKSYDEARRMLEAEAQRSSTPWYYYSSLSALENELKNSPAAQIWSTKARESAKGRATKIQWITSDLLLNAKDKARRDYVLSVTREFYAEALQQKDGFAGRNQARAKKVQEALQAWKTDKDFAKIFAEAQQSCSKQDEDSQRNCQAHFTALR